MVYVITTEIASKEMDKYTDRSLLVICSHLACVCKNPTITYASKRVVCFVYK